MSLPFCLQGLSRHHCPRVYSACVPVLWFHPAISFYSKGDMGMGPWSWDPLVIAHILWLRVCGPDRVLEPAAEAPVQKQYSIPQHLVYTLNYPSLYDTVFLLGRIPGNQGVESGISMHLLLFPVTHWVFCAPHFSISGLCMTSFSPKRAQFPQGHSSVPLNYKLHQIRGRALGRSNWL